MHVERVPADERVNGERPSIRIILDAKDWDTDGINLVQAVVNEDFGVEIEPIDDIIIVVVVHNGKLADKDAEQLFDLGQYFIYQATE